MNVKYSLVILDYNHAYIVYAHYGMANRRSILVYGDKIVILYLIIVTNGWWPETYVNKAPSNMKLL